MAVAFAPGEAEPAATAQGPIREVVRQLLDDQRLRIEVSAYASAEGSSPSQARRVSLSRALAVRRLLIDEGVRSTRIAVRALGNQTERSPADRADLVLIAPS